MVHLVPQEGIFSPFGIFSARVDIPGERKRPKLGTKKLEQRQQAYLLLL